MGVVSCEGLFSLWVGLATQLQQTKVGVIGADASGPGRNVRKNIGMVHVGGCTVCGP
jgi:hypothetical protein